ncbi:MAG: oxygen-independent coproporphyrinogen III oxidase [Balneolaceae bacterium]|jgi:oxygen-independent coproporphyrinogen-3 oxidase
MDVSNIDINLIRKYNVQGPRYTSYPTAVQFREANENDVLQLRYYLLNHNSYAQRISLYIHIPFCFSLCWYCGCTKIITKDTNRGDLYLNYLEKEMNQILPLVHPKSKVVQVHFGGGTPTFLTPEQLHRLGTMIHSRFKLSERTEFSVEIDPRRCSRDHIEALADIGCNRASLGVQDTNEDVQQAIHRIQPFEETKKVTGWLREAGINSINFDLIYGLPKQTTDTFHHTMEDVLTLSPERLAVYSYAHIPSLMPAQKLLKINDMPSTDEKLYMLKSSIDFLTKNDYRFIGMDHFSRRDEELSLAADDGSLQRNFQGYSTLAGADLFAFGMSGISNVGSWYWQNEKDLVRYYECLDEGRSPIFKFYSLNRDDFIRQDVIMSIMCKMGIDYNEIAGKWGINFSTYFNDELARLKELENDGLVIRTNKDIHITENGRLFLRNIAMCFDYYLNASRAAHNYSKTV